MGVVYRAEDVRLGRGVALKLLPDDLAHDQQAVERLRSEARAASALNHSNICTVYDIGEDEGRPFIVMELLSGHNLRDLLSASRLKVHQLVDIAIQIADALDAAHSHGIIHRDIKPANIFVTDRNQAKLLDFGVAKLAKPRSDTTAGTHAMDDLTMPGSTVGTMAYMSPEQATGEPLDGRTDLFSLGMVLYEGATGHHPFVGKTSALVISAILNRTPVAPVMLNPELPQHLQDIINNCLEKDRELRYQSAADLRADLKRLRRDLESGHSRTVPVVSDQRLPVTPPAGHTKSPSGPQPSAAQPFPRRRLVAWGAAAVVVAALLAVWGGYLVSRPRESAPSAGQQPAVTEADLKNRIEQAANELAAQIADQARRAAAEAAATVSAPPPQRPPAPGREAASRPAEPPRPVSPPPAAPAPATPPPANVEPAPTPPPPVEPRPDPAPPARNTTPEPTAPPAVTVPAPAPATPTPAPAPAPDERPDASRLAATQAAQDEASIRRVVANYARAIEGKDIGLFRSIKPNLSREEERRIQDGFRAVTRQTVSLSIVSIERKGQQAVVALKRRDTIQASGRERTVDSQQTLTLGRAGDSWIISEIR
jgi:predicted Ser/Thr protein kinase